MSKPKFSLKSLVHRTQKIDILADVVIDGEIYKGYPVTAVVVRGSSDPKYIQACFDYVEDNREQISSEDPETKLKATHELNIASVAFAVVSWDEEFFDCTASVESCMELFSQTEHNYIFNQIAKRIQDHTDFLPIASQP